MHCPLKAKPALIPTLPHTTPHFSISLRGQRPHLSPKRSNIMFSTPANIVSTSHRATIGRMLTLFVTMMRVWTRFYLSPMKPPSLHKQNIKSHQVNLGLHRRPTLFRLSKQKRKRNLKQLQHQPDNNNNNNLATKMIINLMDIVILMTKNYTMLI